MLERPPEQVIEVKPKYSYELITCPCNKLWCVAASVRVQRDGDRPKEFSMGQVMDKAGITLSRAANLGEMSEGDRNAIFDKLL